MTLFVLEQDEQIAKDRNIPVLWVCWMRQVKDFFDELRYGLPIPVPESEVIRLQRRCERHYQDWIDMYWGGFKGREDYYEAVRKRNESGE